MDLDNLSLYEKMMYGVFWKEYGSFHPPYRKTVDPPSWVDGSTNDCNSISTITFNGYYFNIKRLEIPPDK